MLAVVLVLWNGFVRIDESTQQLRKTQSMTAQLLRGPAVDALMLGNTLTFNQIVAEILRTSSELVCIGLRDRGGSLISQTGLCEDSPPISDNFLVTAPTDDLS